MAPTVFREDGFRFFFFSREEPRIHIHVSHADGEAKFWIDPEVALVSSAGLSPAQVRKAEAMVQSHLQEITHAWHQHFPG